MWTSQGSSAPVSPAAEQTPDTASPRGDAAAAVVSFPDWEADADAAATPGQAAAGSGDPAQAAARGVPMDAGLAGSGYAYEQFSALAGPLTEPPAGQPYRVQYRSIHHSRRERLLTRLIAFVL